VGMKGRSLRILITDAERLFGLRAIRSLGRAGYTVIAAYRKSPERAVSLSSRYCAGSLCYPDPWCNHFELRDWLRHQTNRGEFYAVLAITATCFV
jgi:NAD(P)-dependent dehydrogenase (short-subunit alcohol dehydrogenase family)